MVKAFSDLKLVGSQLDRYRLAVYVVFVVLTGYRCELMAQSEPNISSLSISKVASVIDDSKWVFVDTRPTDAYNGWKLDGIQRGGHLPGAVDFPASWLDSTHDDKAAILSHALRVKQILPRRHVVLYGTKKQERDRVTEYLREAGFGQLYDFDFRLWANDQNKPLVKYENYHLLVPPSIVKQLLDGQIPETFNHAKQIKFAEVSWGGKDASYSKGHVPRSFHVNTDDFEPPPAWKLGSPNVLHSFANKYGFHTDDTVILSGADPTASYRLAIVLRYMGVADVRVLNGGFAAWKAKSYQVETKCTPAPKVESFGAKIPQRPGLIDDIAHVKNQLAQNSTFTLVDTRTWAEFIGETSGYKHHRRKGRIPDSIYAQGDFRGKNSLTPYRNIDDTMRNAAEIKALWKKSGIDKKQHLSFMCGGGWRAAEVLTFAQVMGLSETSLYSDGWIGWSNDRNNPVETGLPANAVKSK